MCITFGFVENHHAEILFPAAILTEKPYKQDVSMWQEQLLREK